MKDIGVEQGRILKEGYDQKNGELTTSWQFYTQSLRVKDCGTETKFP